MKIRLYAWIKETGKYETLDIFANIEKISIDNDTLSVYLDDNL